MEACAPAPCLLDPDGDMVRFPKRTRRGCPVARFAHVANTMAQDGTDFEKGEADGAVDALALVRSAARAWLSHE